MLSASAGTVVVPLLDMVGYEALIAMCARHGVLDVEGDVVEIGTFLGGGALKLARHLAEHHPGKRLQVIDVFDTDVDLTEDMLGTSMASLYRSILTDLSRVGAASRQEEVYRAVTAQYAHMIDTHVGDSRLVTDLGGPVCFGFVDGHHSPAAVRHDFGLVWSRLTPGGACALHDYRGDLPEVTAEIDALIAVHAEEITTVDVDHPRRICFIVRRR